MSRGGHELQFSSMFRLFHKRPELQCSSIFQLFHKHHEEVPNFNFHQFFDFFINVPNFNFHPFSNFFINVTRRSRPSICSMFCRTRFAPGGMGSDLPKVAHPHPFFFAGLPVLMRTPPKGKSSVGWRNRWDWGLYMPEHVIGRMPLRIVGIVQSEGCA